MADKAMTRFDRIIERLQEKFPELDISQITNIDLERLIAIAVATGLMALEGDTIAKAVFDGTEKAFDNTMAMLDYFLPGDPHAPKFADIVPNPHFMKKLEPDAADYSRTPNYEQKLDEDRFLWIRRLRPHRELWMGPFSEWRLGAYQDDIFRFGEHVEPNDFISDTGYENQKELAEELEMVLLGDRNVMWDVLVAWEREWADYTKLISAVSTPVLLIFGLPFLEKMIPAGLEAGSRTISGIAEMIGEAIPG